MLDDQITDGFFKVLTHLSPVGRKKALREIMNFLRKSNRKRIKANINPDGSQFVARKKNKKGKMFQRFGNKMQVFTTADSAEIGFYKMYGVIANNHQYGKRMKYKSGDHTGYFDLPRRKLLGLSDEDKREVSNIIIKHLELA